MSNHLTPDHKTPKTTKDKDSWKKLPASKKKSRKNVSSNLSRNESEEMIAKVAGNPLKEEEYQYRGSEAGLDVDPHVLQATFQTSRSFTHDLDENDEQQRSVAFTIAGVSREEVDSAENPDLDREFALEQEATHETISTNHALEVFNEANDDDLKLVPESISRARPDK